MPWIKSKTDQVQNPVFSRRVQSLMQVEFSEATCKCECLILAAEPLQTGCIFAHLKVFPRSAVASRAFGPFQVDGSTRHLKA